MLCFEHTAQKLVYLQHVYRSYCISFLGGSARQKSGQKAIGISLISTCDYHYINIHIQVAALAPLALLLLLEARCDHLVVAHLN